MRPLVYTVPEVSEVLRVSESHVRRMAKAGLLPVIPIPGRTLFSRDAIHEFARGSESDPSACGSGSGAAGGAGPAKSRSAS